MTLVLVSVSTLQLTLFFIFTPFSGCLLARESENGGNHLTADQTHRLPAGQDGPTFQEEEGTV